MKRTTAANSTTQYTYEYNRVSIVIYRDGLDIFFLQDEKAHELAEELHNAPTEEIEQYILSQYDF